MKRWELEKIILAAQLSNSAKVVGLVITSHWSPKYDRARIRLETMMKEAGGKSRITIIRAVNELIKAQIFIRVRTGRASIIKLGEYAKKSKEQTDSGSIIFDTSERVQRYRKPTTGTRFKEFCPLPESSEDSGERYTKDMEFYLGF